MVLTFWHSVVVLSAVIHFDELDFKMKLSSSKSKGGQPNDVGNIWFAQDSCVSITFHEEFVFVLFIFAGPKIITEQEYSSNQLAAKNVSMKVRFF